MRFVNILVAVVCGLIVLLGYFIPSPWLQSIRSPLLNWAVIMSGVAGLVAILNLVFKVHWKRLRSANTSKVYSFIIFLGFFGTLLAGILLGPANAGFQQAVIAIQVPVQTSLTAILAITLSYSSIKILQRHRNWMGLVFFLSVIVFLVLNSGVLAGFTTIPILRDFLSGLHQVPVAGARGILLGIALGSLTTGLRVLIGSDHPYNG